MNKTLTLFAVASLASAAACSDEETALEVDDDRAHSIALEGVELAQELAESPIRDAPVPFVRLGMIWDGDTQGSLEIATRSDGGAWSAWQSPSVYHVEVEDSSSFVGEITVAGQRPATQYRMRSTSGAVTFVTGEFLELSAGEFVEVGEPYDDTERADETDEDVSFALAGIRVGKARVNSRKSWRAQPPRCKSPTTPNRFTIHHTVTPTNDSLSPEARLRQIQAFHQNSRGWCDIGYNFLVSRDGRLWRGRGRGTLGAHVAGANGGNTGIAFMGTHSSARGTAKQINNVGLLVRGIADIYKIGLNRKSVKGHREQGSTSCPGDALYRQLGAIVKAAKKNAPR